MSVTARETKKVLAIRQGHWREDPHTGTKSWVVAHQVAARVSRQSLQSLSPADAAELTVIAERDPLADAPSDPPVAPGWDDPAAPREAHAARAELNDHAERPAPTPQRVLNPVARRRAASEVAAHVLELKQRERLMLFLSDDLDLPRNRGTQAAATQRRELTVAARKRGMSLASLKAVVSHQMATQVPWRQLRFPAGHPLHGTDDLALAGYVAEWRRDVPAG